jgi:hypothetical protein
MSSTADGSDAHKGKTGGRENRAREANRKNTAQTE